MHPLLNRWVCITKGALRNRGEIGAVQGVVIQNGEGLTVSQPCDAANYRACESGGAELSLGVEVQNCGVGQPIHAWFE